MRYYLSTLLCLLYFLLFSYCLYKSSKYYAEIAPNSFNRICLVFFYTLTIALALPILAIQTGSLSDEGIATNSFGKFYLSFIEYNSDVSTEIKIVFLIWGCICFPLIASYIICGAFGVGRFSFLINRYSKIALILIAKSFIGASAVFLPTLIIVQIENWISYKIPYLLFMIGEFLFLTSFGLTILLIIDGYAEIAKKIKKAENNLSRSLIKIDRFMTRNHDVDER